MNPKNKSVNFEVVVKPEEGQKSIFAEDSFITVTNLDDYRPSKDKNVEVARKLQNNGITVYHIGDFSISASCAAEKFESFFSTKIGKQKPRVKAKAPKARPLRILATACILMVVAPFIEENPKS